MPDVGYIVFLGVPGLALGAGFGLVRPRRRFVAALIGLGMVIALAAFAAVLVAWPEDPLPDDDDLGQALAVFSIATNLGGWTIGLVAGALTRRSINALVRGRPASRLR